MIVFENNPGRLREESEFDAFFAGKVVLVLIAGHFAVGAAIDHGHTVCAKSAGDGGAIDGGVACTDYNDVAADFQGLGCGLAGFNEGEAVDDGFFAFDAEGGGEPSPTLRTIAQNSCCS